jgi:hypothetical protein
MRSLIAATVLLAGSLTACDNDPTTPSRISDQELRAAAPHEDVEAAGSWTTRAPMPTARFALVAVGAQNGLVYAIGGATHVFAPALSTVEAYQASTNRWTPKASLPEPRLGASGAAAINGKIYVPGETSAAGTQKSLFIYNTSTNSWTSGANLPVPSALGACAFIGGNCT